jgi:GH18 family chitinase
MANRLDWEYPVASDRGGVPADYSNLVLLVSDIREAFDSYDPGWQITLTLPASYWYLKNFDIKRLEKHIDWFNMMTYDIHGVWDQHNIWTGPFLKGHTNITEIEDGLDLLWRSGIDSGKVVMGYGLYGRGFTMQDPSCSKPPDCEFSGPAFAGDCTNEPGILSYNGEFPST